MPDDDQTPMPHDWRSIGAAAAIAATVGGGGAFVGTEVQSTRADYLEERIDLIFEKMDHANNLIAGQSEKIELTRERITELRDIFQTNRSDLNDRINALEQSFLRDK